MDEPDGADAARRAGWGLSPESPEPTGDRARPAGASESLVRFPGDQPPTGPSDGHGVDHWVDHPRPLVIPRQRDRPVDP